MAVRIGSMVTLLKLTPSEKNYRHHRGNCLPFREEKCGKCISRYPAGAITDAGHDRDKCYEYIRSKPLQDKLLEYGIQDSAYSCGLCQTDVLCEFKIPRPDLIA